MAPDENGGLSIAYIDRSYDEYSGDLFDVIRYKYRDSLGQLTDGASWPSVTGPWVGCEPENVALAQPLYAAGDNGRVHITWWDACPGTQLMHVVTNGTSWSAPDTVLDLDLGVYELPEESLLNLPYGNPYDMDCDENGNLHLAVVYGVTNDVNLHYLTYDYAST